MQKKKNVFTVSSMSAMNGNVKRTTVKQALQIVVKQGEAEGLRDKTLADYKKWLLNYSDFNRFNHVDQFNMNSIYLWLGSMPVKNSTKRIRLKALKAVLGRMFNAGLIDNKFYKPVTIRVDEEIKEGTTEKDLEKLLSHLDMTNFFHLRDACAILLIWQTGIRISTLSQLESSHIDFDNKLLICTGDIMKNRRRLVLPLPDQLLGFLSSLLEQNEIIRAEFGFENDWVFMTKTGKSFLSPTSGNVFANRLIEYSKQFGIKNINAHAIRRGFARRLLDEGVSIPVISKALGHSSIAVTTKYLHVSEAELINEVKRLF